eukprot:gene15819-17414_t
MADSATYKQVGTLKEITYYPLKSCRGISVVEANCNVKGLDYDRHWVIMDRGGRPVMLKSRSELALIVPTMISETEMKIEAPGMQPLVIPLELSSDNLEYADVEIYGVTGNGVRVSVEADNWFSEYLGKPHSFLAFHSSCKPRYFRDKKTFGKMPYVKDTDCVAYANGCPYLIVSEASLAALNERHSGLQFDMKRFRPNLVVEGSGEFSEDTWTWVKVGTAVFRCMHRCGRCPLPNVDPVTGERHKTEPLSTLKEFRLAGKDEEHLYKKNPLFGRNLAVEVAGIVKQGDAVYASI